MSANVMEPRPRPSWRQAGRDMVYLLPGLPISILSFTLMITGFCLGIGLIPLALVGIPVLMLTLAIARGFAAFERVRIQAMEGRAVGPVYHRSATGTGFGRILSYLRDAQSWQEWAYSLVIFFVRTITWSFALVWVTGAVAGLTYPLWGWIITVTTNDEDNTTLTELLGWDAPAADLVLNFAFGVVFALTLPYVMRGLATVESKIGWLMLTNENAALRARAEELTRSRRAVVQAEADTLRRVERDIHDGPQQRLVRLTMDLQSAQRRLQDDPVAAAPLLDGALTQTQEALAELRALSRGIAPPILTDRGLAAALAAAAARCPVPTTVDVQLAGETRLPSSVENAAYFVATESLTNVAKHSNASQCEVSVVRVGPSLYVQVSDDGLGGAHLGKGHGLAGLSDRLAGVDGTLTVSSPPGAGTVILAEIPVGSG
ncbi:MAG: sensor histidine kinase [Jiangellaceae bacterium]